MTDRSACVARDRADPLARFRDRFHLPEGVIYLDGNSLGALPRDTPGRIAKVVAEEWGHDLIRSWNLHDWIGLAHRIGDKIGRLIGAAPGTVIVGDSTSVNVFKLLAAALDLRPERRVVLSDDGNFPTDLYMAQGLAALRGGITLRVVPEAELASAIGPDVAVVTATHVNYRTGRLHDLADLTRRAHAVGALTMWDLSHSAGAMSVGLDAIDADFAVGCGYKYLNGGPGAPAFLHVAQRHQAEVRPPLSGWLGHDRPFDFDLDYRPGAGIRRNVCGTPPILSMAALEVGVDLMLEADLAAIRAKSQALGDLFLELVAARCPGMFRVACPGDAEQRGSQVSLAHREGYAIMQAVIARGVIGDFRAPDVLRFGFAPLYVGYADVWDAVDRLAEVIASGVWREPRFAMRRVVT
jgi:kynureninase